MLNEKNPSETFIVLEMGQGVVGFFVVVVGSFFVGLFFWLFKFF